MSTPQGLVSQVLEEGSFAVSEATALNWLEARHKSMCARTRCYRRKIEIGPTVAQQQQYAVPAEVMEIRECQVGSLATGALNQVPYGVGIHTDLAQGALGYIWLGGLFLAVGGGIFVRDENAAGEEMLSLYPIPTESGLNVTLYAVCRPEPLSLTAPALVVGGSATLRFCYTTRALTEAERATFVGGGGLPGGVGTEAGLSSVTLEYRQPGGGWTAGTVVKDAMGAWHSTVTPLTAAGELEWRAKGLEALGHVLWEVVESERVGTGQQQIKVPEDALDALVEGAIATGLRRVEGRPDLAAAYDAVFDAKCVELAREVNARFRNAGPAQIRVRGWNA